MPNRTARGSLPGRLKLADEYIQAKLGNLLRQTDELTETTAGSPFGGGALSREEFRTLAVNDPQFQERLAFRMVFANDKEKAALSRELERAYQAGVGAPPPIAAPPEAPVGPTGPPPPLPPVQAAPTALAAGPPAVAPIVQDAMGTQPPPPLPPLPGGPLR